MGGGNAAPPHYLGYALSDGRNSSVNGNGNITLAFQEEPEVSLLARCTAFFGCRASEFDGAGKMPGAK